MQAFTIADGLGPTLEHVKLVIEQEGIIYCGRRLSRHHAVLCAQLLCPQWLHAC